MGDHACPRLESLIPYLNGDTKCLGDDSDIGTNQAHTCPDSKQECGYSTSGSEDHECDQVCNAGRLFPILSFNDSPRQDFDAIGRVLDGVDLRTCP